MRPRAYINTVVVDSFNCMHRTCQSDKNMKGKAFPYHLCQNASQVAIAEYGFLCHCANTTVLKGENQSIRFRENPCIRSLPSLLLSLHLLRCEMFHVLFKTTNNVPQ